MDFSTLKTLLLSPPHSTDIAQLTLTEKEALRDALISYIIKQKEIIATTSDSEKHAAIREKIKATLLVEKL